MDMINKILRSQVFKKATSIVIIAALFITTECGVYDVWAFSDDSSKAAYTEDSKIASVEAEDSEDPDNSEAEPGNSEDPDNPGTDPDNPDNPGTDPDNPDNPDNPDTPDKPSKPVKPKVPVLKVTKNVYKSPGLILTWDKVPKAKYYRVYKCNSKGKLKKRLVQTKKRKYTHKKVKAGKRTYYKVVAFMPDGTKRYSKLKSGKIYRVFIETGHGINILGRWDPGCTYGKYQEARLMIPICKSYANALRKNGVYVYTDAFDGNNINLLKSIASASKKDINAFVHVHCDYEKAPRGTLPLYKTSEQKKLAKELNKGVLSKVKIKTRGLEKRNDLRSLNTTAVKCTSVLFETGNIKKDNKILRKKYKAYGEGLAKGTCSYLGIAYED